MSSEPQWLISRSLVAVSAGGERSNVTLAVGVPRELSPEEWACPVRMSGLHEQLHDVHGIDAWQTVQLALSLQAQLLGHFIEEGGTLLCHEPPEPVSLQELFPQVPSVRGS
jgi:hypothetical protein